MILLAAASIVSCLSLSAVDGDSIKSNGVRMRLIGDGIPFKSGVDAPEMGDRAKCAKERTDALQAKLRLEELLRIEGIAIEDTGKVDRWRRSLVRVRLPDGRTAESVRATLRSGGREGRSIGAIEPRAVARGRRCSRSHNGMTRSCGEIDARQRY